MRLIMAVVAGGGGARARIARHGRADAQGFGFRRERVIYPSHFPTISLPSPKWSGSGCRPFCGNPHDGQHEMAPFAAGVMMVGGFKFEVRQIGRGCHPDISVSTQAPSSCGVRVCIETEMSFSLQAVAFQEHDLSHFKLEATRHGHWPTAEVRPA